MNIRRLTIIIIPFLLTLSSYSQEYNTNDHYEQAMQNAKIAFEANQYSQAVMFYREAQSIKPEALLPKYKIEDIRTIYIKIELDSLQKAPPAVVVAKPKKKKKKEVEAEQKLMEKQAEELATTKLNEEVELAKQELEEIKQEAETLYIDEATIEIDEENIESTSTDRETKLSSIDSRSATKLEGSSTNSDLNLTVTKKEVPEIKIEEQPSESIQEPVQVPQEKIIIKKDPIPSPVKVEPKKVTKTVDLAKDENWIEEENKRLADKYPNEKTVEEIEKPGKFITRVVMNINGKVTTYLKVKHSWGATYFFIDEVGLELKSISQTHFNRMTDLSTYKNE